MPLPLRLQGTVCYWRDDKGFGFVITYHKERVFFHIRDFKQTPARRPQQGDRLSFELGVDKRQRRYAQSLQLEESSVAQIKPAKATGPNFSQIQQQAWCFRYLFFALLLLSLLAGSFAFTVPLFYLEASLFTYWLYQIDKKLAASGHSSRLSEESLQMFSLIGGWPGALIAQKRLHHKVHKMPFNASSVLWFMAIVAFYSGYLSESGSNFLQKVTLF